MDVAEDRGENECRVRPSENESRVRPSCWCHICIEVGGDYDDDLFLWDDLIVDDVFDSTLFTVPTLHPLFPCQWSLMSWSRGASVRPGPCYDFVNDIEWRAPLWTFTFFSEPQYYHLLWHMECLSPLMKIPINTYSWYTLFYCSALFQDASAHSVGELCDCWINTLYRLPSLRSRHRFLTSRISKWLHYIRKWLFLSFDVYASLTLVWFWCFACRPRVGS